MVKPDQPCGEQTILGSKLTLNSHDFTAIDPMTGSVNGAVKGHKLFKFGGKDNKLSVAGKIMLDKESSGKFKRRATPYVPPGDFEPIDFYETRLKCLQTGEIFTDPQFPANFSALFRKDPTDDPIIWRRPGEMIPHPQFIAEGKSRFDIRQGDLGDCWFLAALASFTMRDELFYRVVPPDQSFTDNYAGIFHFQFWNYGVWVDVVIDDLLPYSKKEGKFQLWSLQSTNGNGFWPALLEKAFAKLVGCYEYLISGYESDAFEWLTGGISKSFFLEDVQKQKEMTKVVELLEDKMQANKLFSAFAVHDYSEEGIFGEHCYSVTAFKRVKTREGTEVELIRVRNPWGKTEWNRSWSDGHYFWDRLDEGVKKEMRHINKDDGEFWMEFSVFANKFPSFTCCYLPPTVMDEVHKLTGITGPTHYWTEKNLNGDWNTGDGTAKGYINVGMDSERVHCGNPQFSLKVHPSSDPSTKIEGKCSMVVGVMQKHRRERSHELSFLIGFMIFKANASGCALSQNDISKQEPIAKDLRIRRSAVASFDIEPGNYVIIPSTKEPNSCVQFMMRVFASTVFDLQRL